ncbi:MAG: hypothetical protein QW616_05685 [Thermoplasmata archaeon]
MEDKVIYKQDLRETLQQYFIFWFFETYKDLIDSISLYKAEYNNIAHSFYTSSLSSEFIKSLRKKCYLVLSILKSLDFDSETKKLIEETNELVNKYISNSYRDIPLEVVNTLLDNFSKILSRTFLKGLATKIPTPEERLKRSLI